MPALAMQQGLVVAHLGRAVAVEVVGVVHRCQTLRQLPDLVVGDEVLVNFVGAVGRIEKLLPRRSLLCRPGGRKTRAVVANIDLLGVVLAAVPSCDFLLLDQYLAICENSNIEAVLLVNKIDIASTAGLEKQLQVYGDLGYPIHTMSATTKQGVAGLAKYLRGQACALVGQSGVGKSSLGRALLPNEQLKTGALSQSRHGRHTTTTATLYRMSCGGCLIDSPGVAIFGLADFSQRQLAFGYREFQPWLGTCKFNDCRHLHDKGCGITAAVERGVISQRRYLRFVKLQQKLL